MDFYTAWWFLANHKIFKDDFKYDRLWTHVAKVNPETGKLDDDMTKNTKVEIWLECFPDDENGRFHIAIELKDVRFVASLDKKVKTFSDSKKTK